ncbi:hypothetical protein HDU93_002480 [Gonapodya sp. JEL0774]|nr:hypothetical protein HDU93_002480 [Gonapodya sp. JEL0774]
MAQTRKDGWDWEPDAEDGEWVEASPSTVVPGVPGQNAALQQLVPPFTGTSLSNSTSLPSTVTSSYHSHDPDSPHTALLVDDTHAIPLVPTPSRSRSGSASNGHRATNGRSSPSFFGRTGGAASDIWLQRLSDHRGSSFSFPRGFRDLTGRHFAVLALAIILLVSYAGYSRYSAWLDTESSDYQFDVASDAKEMESLALFFHDPDPRVVRRNIESILPTPEDLGLPSDPSDPKYVDLSYDALFPERSVSEPPRLVVSLSTFRGRAELIKDTIISLAESQSRKPDRIYVHMPADVRRLRKPGASPTAESDSENTFKQPTSSTRRPPLPDVLAELVRSLGPTYLVITHPPDFGSSTKLLPSIILETDPSTVIVTVDDDTTYEKDTLRSLERTLLASDGSHHTAYRCEEPTPPWLLWWSVWVTPIEVPGSRSTGSDGSEFSPRVCRGFACAFAGTAFLRSQFKGDAKELFDYRKAPLGCRLHDDVWISGILWTWGITPMIVDADVGSVVHHRSYTNLTIHRVRGVESRYRDPCIQYFEYFRRRMDAEEAMDAETR